MISCVAPDICGPGSVSSSQPWRTTGKAGARSETPRLLRRNAVLRHQSTLGKVSKRLFQEQLVLERHRINGRRSTLPAELRLNKHPFPETNGHVPGRATDYDHFPHVQCPPDTGALVS